jgi:hypothetical protein
VLRAQVQETRVGGEREGKLPQAEVLQIHGRKGTPGSESCRFRCELHGPCGPRGDRIACCVVRSHNTSGPGATD